MEDIIRLENLTVVLNSKTILEGISFRVGSGELIGIIGPNGAGKTTLLRVLLGMLPPRQGEVTVLGRSTRQLAKVRHKIGYMPQRHSFEQRFPLSAADVVAMGLLSRSARGASGGLPRRAKIARALEEVGLPEMERKPFRELSGGQQQLVLLARALVHEPVLLLLDEPNSGLDFIAQQKFFNLLRRLQQTRNLTVLIVSHDLLSVAQFASALICINRTMHIHGHPREVLHSPRLAEAYRCPFDLLSMAGREEQ